jgi:Putative auto-transporter adhesin, head GIN domain
MRLRSLLPLSAAVTATAALLALSSSGFAGPTVTGSGTSAKQSRSVDEFQSIKLNGSIDLEFRIAPKVSVELIADDNLLPRITTEVKNKALTIALETRDGESIQTRTPIRAVVTAPSLTGLAILGSGDAVATGISGDQLSIAISGSGSAKVSGSAKRVNAAVKGSGDIEAKDLISTSATMAIQGSGDISLHVKSSLTAAISGSGDINVYGKPPSVTRVVDGTGEVRLR